MQRDLSLRRSFVPSQIALKAIMKHAHISLLIVKIHIYTRGVRVFIENKF